MRTVLLFIGLLTMGSALAQTPNPKTLLPTLPVAGELVMARRWEDRQGVNYLLLTRTPDQQTYDPEYPNMRYLSARLYGYHFVQQGEGFRLLRQITDFIEDCELDMTVTHIPASVRLTDLDNDGDTEVSFLYELACRGDVSPLTLKLMMLEAGEKYAIRGTSIIDVGNGERYGGEKRIDEAFAKAPAAFRDFASRHWERFVDPSKR
jgi:hypothetical protein